MGQGFGVTAQLQHGTSCARGWMAVSGHLFGPDTEL